MVWTWDLSDANSNREKRRERTAKLIRPSTSSEVAVYGSLEAQPIEDPNLARKVTTSLGSMRL
jgi:hypothetical protein